MAKSKKAQVAPVEAPQVNEENPKIETAIPPVEEAPAVEPTPAPEPTNDSAMVNLISADGRALEVAVGGESWNGRVISVPKKQADDIRRILTEGGFFLKD